MRGDSERHNRIYRRIENQASSTRTLTVVLEGLTSCRRRKWEGDARLKQNSFPSWKFRQFSLSIDLIRVHSVTMAIHIFAIVPLVKERDIFRKMTISYVAKAFTGWKASISTIENLSPELRNNSSGSCSETKVNVKLLRSWKNLSYRKIIFRIYRLHHLSQKVSYSFKYLFLIVKINTLTLTFSIVKIGNAYILTLSSPNYLFKITFILYIYWLLIQWCNRIHILYIFLLISYNIISSFLFSLLYNLLIPFKSTF